MANRPPYFEIDTTHPLARSPLLALPSHPEGAFLRDRSTRANHGAFSGLTGNSLIWDRDLGRYVLDCDGNQDYTSHGRIAEIDGDWLITCWVKHTSAARYDWVMKQYSAADRGFGVYTLADNWVFTIGPDGYQIASAAGTLVAGAWTHLGFYVSGTTREIWKNGTLLTSGTVNRTNSVSQPFQISGSSADGVSSLLGQICDVMILPVSARSYIPALADPSNTLLEVGGRPLILPPRRRFLPAAVAAPSGAISGSTTLTFAASGALAGDGALSGSSFIAFSPSGDVTGIGTLSGSATLAFSASATLAGNGTLAGSTSLIFTPTGVIAAKGTLAGSSSLVFTSSGALAANGFLSGATTLAFSPSGSLTGIGSLAGTTTVDFSAAGSLQMTGSLSGAASITFSPSAVIRGTGSLLGITSLIFTPAGLLAEKGGIASGTTILSFTSSGRLYGTGFILGSSTIIFTPSGVLSRATSGPLRRGTEATESLPHRQSTTTTAVLRRPPSGTGGLLRRQN